MIYASNQRFQAKQTFGIQQDQFEILWVEADDSAHLPDMLVKKNINPQLPDDALYSKIAQCG